LLFRFKHSDILVVFWLSRKFVVVYLQESFYFFKSDWEGIVIASGECD
jgi:hypothetical protein